MWFHATTKLLQFLYKANQKLVIVLPFRRQLGIFIMVQSLESTWFAFSTELSLCNHKWGCLIRSHMPQKGTCDCPLTSPWKGRSFCWVSIVKGSTSKNSLLQVRQGSCSARQSQQDVTCLEKVRQSCYHPAQSHKTSHQNQDTFFMAISFGIDTQLGVNWRWTSRFRSPTWKGAASIARKVQPKCM
jgi:hypothetical protein